ncbi:MAG: hypothetical protein Kow00124_22070 [Anaerolineae bacterium]
MNPMLDLLIDLLITSVILLAIYGAGSGLRPLLPLRPPNRPTELAIRLALGLGAITTLLFGLALIGWLIPIAGWTLLGVGLLLALRHIRPLATDMKAAYQVVRETLRQSGFAWVLLGLTLAFVLVNLVADLAPATEADTVQQYLLLPRYWVDSGHYTQPAHIWAATLPGNMMMLSAWALLLRPANFALPQLVTGFGMSLFFMLGVYTLARLYYERGAALFAVSAAYVMPSVGYLATSAKVDMGWAFFETLTLLAFFRWLDLTVDSEKAPLHEDPPLMWLALAGLCLGWAIGSKNQPFSIPLLGLWLVIHLAARRRWRSLWNSALVFGLAVLAAGFPYYLYNAIVHHNPFYPVYADLFAGLFGGSPSPRSEVGADFYPISVGGYLVSLWYTSLGHPPEFARGFIAGPLYLLVIPAGALLGQLRRDRIVARMLGYSFIFSIVWFLVKQARTRHFLPGLVLLSVIAGLVLWQLSTSRRRAHTVILAMAALALGWNLAINAATLYWNGAYRVALGLESRAEYLERWHDEVILPTWPDWEMITELNTRLGPEDRILSRHNTSALYIIPQFVSSGWGDRVSYEGFTSAEDLLAALEAARIGYVITYDADPPGPQLFTETWFLEEYTTLLYDGARANLYQINPR